METDLERIDGRDDSPISQRRKLKDVHTSFEEGSHQEHKVTRSQEDPDPSPAEQSGRQGEKGGGSLDLASRALKVFSLKPSRWEAACRSERRE